jgi:hypothetical protein
MRTMAIAAVLALTALAACDDAGREKLPGVDATKPAGGRTEVDANPARRAGVDAVTDSVAGRRRDDD